MKRENDFLALHEQAQKEQLLNVMAMAIRESLAPDDVLQTAIAELGRVFPQCRCILYRCHPNNAEVTIGYEFTPTEAIALVCQTWSISRQHFTASGTLPRTRDGSV